MEVAAKARMENTNTGMEMTSASIVVQDHRARAARVPMENTSGSTAFLPMLMDQESRIVHGIKTGCRVLIQSDSPPRFFASSMSGADGLVKTTWAPCA